MKISCTQENLNKGLGLCSRIISSPKTLPILSNVLLSSDKGKLKLSVTNLEVGINVWIRAKIEKEGSITVPARILYDFVANNRDPNIDLETKDLNLLIKSDSSEANITGIESSEFPIIPTLEDKNSFEIDVKSFEKSIPKVLIACAVDESRPVLSGVYFNFEGNKLKLVATDSYRLAEETINLSTKVDLAKIILPMKTLQEIHRIIGVVNTENKIKVNLADNQAVFKFGSEVEVSSRLIEGNFPSYEQIIPTSPSTNITINRAEFLSAIKSASLFSQNTTNNIKIKTEKDLVTVFAHSNQIGDSKIKVKSENNGENLEIAFNARFLLDALNNMNGEKIELGLTEKLAPAKLTDPKDKDYLYVIMPLRTEE